MGNKTKLPNAIMKYDYLKEFKIFTLFIPNLLDFKIPVTKMSSVLRSVLQKAYGTPIEICVSLDTLFMDDEILNIT